jgi:uncharacterized membrane protein YhiD involved in acid resistance
MGLFIAWTYRSTHRQLTASFSFVNTLIMLSMIMTLVMMVIGNNIARAFGLAGAMSIIRFRTVVKDTRDTAFVFFAIASGMGSGTGNLRLSILGTLLVGFFIFVLHWTRHGAISRNEFLLTLRMLPPESEEERKIYLPLFERFLSTHRLVSVKSTKMGDSLKLTFHVVMRDPKQTEVFISELSGLEGLHRVSLSFGDSAEN